MTNPESNDDQQALPEFSAPKLNYQPRAPRSYRPAIGMIGCGGITANHLRAYRTAGFDLAALCDVNRELAERRRKEFFPEATVYDDHRQLLARENIEVVDITTHPAERVGLIEDALKAHKHVLSQKPFVLDLDVGERLADLAQLQGVRLAVNQNGRWAPHFSYMREAIATGLLGKLASVAMTVHWDHHWIAGTEFENVKHLILYDFAIHWFDILTCFAGGSGADRVFASFARSPGQTVRPALMGQTLIEFEEMQAELMFDGATRYGATDRTFLRGTRGSIESSGPDCKTQQLSLFTCQGVARVKLEGCWFPDGFRGTMGELLLAIEEDREPTVSARNNLASLALCFAAVASAERKQPVTPGSVRQMPS